MDPAGCRCIRIDEDRAGKVLLGYNSVKNFVGEMIRILWYGFKNRRSRSQVTMQSAFSSNAQARTTLSLGSRQSLTSRVTSLTSAPRCTVRSNSILSLGLMPNFGRERTSSSSEKRCSDMVRTNSPCLNARYTEVAGWLPNKAATNTLVSMTAFGFFIMPLPYLFADAGNLPEGNRVFLESFADSADDRIQPLCPGFSFEVLDQLDSFFNRQAVDEFLHIKFQRELRHLIDLLVLNIPDAVDEVKIKNDELWK